VKNKINKDLNAKAYMKSLNKGYTFKYYLPIYKNSKQDYSKKLN